MREQRLRRVAAYLAVVQFLFFTTWIVYIVYLGDLLKRVGIGEDKLLWFVLLDQLLFAVMDVLMGFAADRIRYLIGRIGPFILGVNTLSCIGFVAMPWLAETGSLGVLGQAVWVGALVLWVATSSVLRAPAFVLVTQHASQSQVSWLVALSLVGLAVGGAVGPYLGVVLKTVDPLLPFLLTGVTLWLTTVGLIFMERYLAEGGKPVEPAQPPQTIDDPAARKLLFSLLAGALLLALGFQVHFFVNSAAQYLQFAEPEKLAWLMPVFWIGFNLLVFPGSGLSAKHGPWLVMLLAVVLGVVGLWVASYNFGLDSLIIAQLLAGGAWGVLFMAGISASLHIGGKAHGGLVLGSWFSMLALGALVRVLIVLNGLPKQTAFADWMNALPAICWVLAGICLLLAQRFYQQHQDRLAENRLGA